MKKQCPLFLIVAFFLTLPFTLKPAEQTTPAAPPDNHVIQNRNDAVGLEANSESVCCQQRSFFERCAEVYCGPRGSRERQLSLLSALLWIGTIGCYALNLHSYSSCRSHNPTASCDDIQPSQALVESLFILSCASTAATIGARVASDLQLSWCGANHTETNEDQ